MIGYVGSGNADLLGKERSHGATCGSDTGSGLKDFSTGLLNDEPEDKLDAEKVLLLMSFRISKAALQADKESSGPWL